MKVLLSWSDKRGLVELETLAQFVREHVEVLDDPKVEPVEPAQPVEPVNSVSEERARLQCNGQHVLRYDSLNGEGWYCDDCRGFFKGESLHCVVCNAYDRCHNCEKGVIYQKCQGRHTLSLMVCTSPQYRQTNDSFGYYCDECLEYAEGESLHCTVCDNYDRCAKCHSAGDDFDDVTQRKRLKK